MPPTASALPADPSALRAAFELQTPVVYFRALAPGQYWVVAPAFVTADDPAARFQGGAFVKAGPFGD